MISLATARAGQSLVVQGAGGLGINAVAVARDMGADTIIVVDRLASRLALAKSFGADHTVDASEIASVDQRVEAVKALTGGFGADVVADFVGYADVIPEGLRMLRGGGCYLEVGSISPGNEPWITISGAASVNAITLTARRNPSQIDSSGLYATGRVRAWILTPMAPWPGGGSTRGVIVVWSF